MVAASPVPRFIQQRRAGWKLKNYFLYATLMTFLIILRESYKHKDMPSIQQDERSKCITSVTLADDFISVLIFTQLLWVEENC